MKRDPDLIRTILLAAEADQHWLVGAGAFSDLGDWTTILGHLKIAEDAGYLEIQRSAKGHPQGWRVTWSGHEFLDNTRNSEVWATAKAGATRAGSWSIKLIGEMAAAIVRGKATELGLLPPA